MLRRLRTRLAALAIAAVSALTVLAWAPGSANAAVASTAAPQDVIGPGSYFSGYMAFSPPATPFGYSLQGPTEYGWGASANWVQPAGTCTSTDTAASFWVGLGKSPNVPVERAGTDTDCSGGSPVYSAWSATSMSSQTTFGGTIQAGDSMTAGVICFGSNCSMSVFDHTAGWNATASTPLSGTPTSSEVMVSRATSGLVPLTNFGTVTFSSTSYGAAAVSTFNPVKLAPITNAAAAPLDSLTALGGGDNPAFSATWLRSS
jgi:hypothetical protein